MQHDYYQRTSYQCVTSYAGSLYIELWHDAWKLQSDTICGWSFAEHITKVMRSTTELQLLSSAGLNNHDNREINCSTRCLLFGTPQPTSGREMTNRIQQNTEDKQKSEEVRRSHKWSLYFCGVVTITFRMLSLFVVTKCYSHSRTVSQLIVVPPGEYPINWFI
jgi:hypothetical protein